MVTLPAIENLTCFRTRNPGPVTLNISVCSTEPSPALEEVRNQDVLNRVRDGRKVTESVCATGLERNVLRLVEGVIEIEGVLNRLVEVPGQRVLQETIGADLRVNRVSTSARLIDSHFRQRGIQLVRGALKPNTLSGSSRVAHQSSIRTLIVPSQSSLARNQRQSNSELWVEPSDRTTQLITDQRYINRLASGLCRHSQSTDNQTQCCDPREE